MRKHVDYSERCETQRAKAIYQGVFVGELLAGFYRLRRGAGSVYRPVAIWYGPPFDPETGEEMDRSWRWQVLYCGRTIWDHNLVWPACAGQPIDRAEYEYLLERVLFAREHDPNDPFGTKNGRVDWLTSTPPF